MEDRPKASIIIPCYNGEKTIRNCLNSVSAQEFNDYEVLVIDSSTDNTPRIIKREFPEIELHHFDERKSCGEAKNIGVGISKGEHIFFLDHNKVVNNNWISRALGIFEKEKDISGLSGSIEDYPESTIIGKTDHLLEYYHWLPCQKRKENARYIAGGASVYKRGVFSEDRFENVYGEDVIFSVKSAAKGHRFLFEPSIKIKHINIESRTFISFLKNQIKVGEGSAITRKMVNKGYQIFLRFPALIFIAPIYLVPKMALTYLVRDDFDNFLFFLKYFPLFFIGNFFWATGFFREAVRPV